MPFFARKQARFSPPVVTMVSRQGGRARLAPRPSRCQRARRPASPYPAARFARPGPPPRRAPARGFEIANAAAQGAVQPGPVLTAPAGPAAPRPARRASAGRGVSYAGGRSGGARQCARARPPGRGPKKAKARYGPFLARAPTERPARRARLCKAGRQATGEAGCGLAKAGPVCNGRRAPSPPPPGAGLDKGRRASADPRATDGRRPFRGRRPGAAPCRAAAEGGEGCGAGAPGGRGARHVGRWGPHRKARVTEGSRAQHRARGGPGRSRAGPIRTTLWASGTGMSARGVGRRRERARSPRRWPIWGRGPQPPTSARRDLTKVRILLSVTDF